MRAILRKHINPATAMAFVAMLFAITGGAFAASGGGNEAGGAHSTIKATAAKQKPAAKGKRGPRGPAGPKGATGATGPAGAPGTTGPAGAIGAQGAQGPQGLQGEKGVAGANGKNGTNGTTGFTKTLPSGATETGAWFAETTGSNTDTAISFPIPLAAALTWGEGHAGEPEDQTHYINPSGKEVMSVGAEVPASAACPGNAEEPEATPGNLCIYAHIAPTESDSGSNELIFNPAGGHDTESLGASTAGALVGVGSGRSSGTWAVTAE